MPKHTQPEERRRHQSGLRRVRQPWHLQELETAAQTDVDAVAENAGQPLENEAHPGMAFGGAGAYSGRDPEQLPVDSGLSIDPEDLGLQFLRDATEQDNFESEFQSEPPTVPDQALGELLSEETLLAAGREETESFLGPPSSRIDEEHQEIFVADVDLLSNVIYEASLFDATTEQDETLTPRIESDETEGSPQDTEARAREQERERRALRRLRVTRRGRR